MKKLLASIAAASALILFFQACQKDVPQPVEKVVKVSIGDVQDSSFVFAIVPEGETESYAYMVDEGEAYDVEASVIMDCKGKGFVSGSRKYQKDSSLMMSISDLEPGTTYTVYAVARDSQGTLTKVATATTTTSDTVIPSIKSFTSNGNTVTIEFIEDVIFVDGSEILATPYCKMFLTGSPAGAAVEGTLKEVSGNKATIEFADITTPGTYYTVSYDEGTFTDVNENPCEALKSKFTSAVKPDGSCSYEGVYGTIANADLVYVMPKVAEEIDIARYSTTALSVKVPAGVNRVDLVDNYITTIVHEGGASENVKMAKITHYYGSYYDATVKFAGNVIAGDKVSITIPAGAIQDWYGNVNSKDIVLGPSTIVKNDTKAPAIASYSSDGNMFTVQFSEDVKYVSGDIKATPYCKMYVTGAPAASAVTGEIKSVSGKNVTILFDAIKTPGTYYTVNIPEGAFTDLSGNPCAEVKSSFTGAVDAYGNCPCNGIYGKLVNGEIAYKLPAITTLAVSKYSTQQISVNIPDGVTRVDIVDNYITTVTHKNGSSDNFKMAKITNYYGSYYDVIVKCAGSAVVGDKVTITIPAGAVMDWYGNVNGKDITVGPIEIVAD